MRTADRLRLHTLGGLYITRGERGATGVAVRRKPLALLALLAGSTSHGISRDKLAAFLWPEADTESARTVLRQTLYALRRDLRAPDLLIGSIELRLNPAVIVADVSDFEDALAREDWDRAVSLYRGPFLDGFHLSGAPEFARWQEDERAKRDASARAAIECLASGAHQSGDLATAVQWWTRLAEMDPHSRRVTVRLMHALVASGDPARAIEHAQQHLNRLEADLGVAGDREITALVERIHADTLSAASARQAVRATMYATTQERPPSGSVGDASNPTETAGVPRDGTARRRAFGIRPRTLLTRRGVLPIGVVLVTGVLAVSTASLKSSGVSGPVVSGPARVPLVAIMPFTVHGASVAYLGVGLPKLLAAGLDGSGRFRSADERAILGLVRSDTVRALDMTAADSVARRLGADYFVVGDIIQSAGRVRVMATMHPRSVAGVQVTKSVEGDTSRVFELADQITRELIGAHLTRPSERLAAVASVTTQSLPAFKAYLEGEAHMRALRYPEAVIAFRRAGNLDTSFALAFHRLSEAADWTGQPALVDSAARRAAAYAHRLTERERRLLFGMLAWRSGETDRAEALLEALTDDYPLDVDGWYQLGEVRFHSAPRQGRPLRASIRPFERVLEFEPTHRGALRHLARLYTYQGRHQDSDEIVRRAQEAEGDTALSKANLLTAITAGTVAERAAVAERMRAWPLSPLADAIRHVVFTGNPRDANTHARIYASRAVSVADRIAASVAVAETDAARGRFKTADATLAASTAILSPVAPGLRALLANVPYAALSLGAGHLSSLRDTLAALDARSHDVPPASASALDVSFARYQLAVLNVWFGDTLSATRHATALGTASLAQTTRGLSTVYSRGVRADLAMRSGDHLGALRLLADSQPPISLELQATVPGTLVRERWNRAEALRELGRFDESLAWYDALAVTSPHESPYLAPSHLRRAQVYESLGDTASAARHYARFAELWADCDVELRPMVQDAQRRAYRFGAWRVGAEAGR